MPVRYLDRRPTRRLSRSSRTTVAHRPAAAVELPLERVGHTSVLAGFFLCQFPPAQIRIGAAADTPSTPAPPPVTPATPTHAADLAVRPASPVIGCPVSAKEDACPGRRDSPRAWPSPVGVTTPSGATWGRLRELGPADWKT